MTTLTRAERICKTIQSKYDCLCSIGYSYTGSAGVRVFLYFLGETPSVRDEFIEAIKDNGAIIAVQDNGDIMLHDFDSLEAAVEAI